MLKVIDIKSEDSRGCVGWLPPTKTHIKPQQQKLRLNWVFYVPQLTQTQIWPDVVWIVPQIGHFVGDLRCILKTKHLHQISFFAERFSFEIFFPASKCTLWERLCEPQRTLEGLWPLRESTLAPPVRIMRMMMVLMMVLMMKMMANQHIPTSQNPTTVGFWQ